MPFSDVTTVGLSIRGGCVDYAPSSLIAFIMISLAVTAVLGGTDPLTTETAYDVAYTYYS